MLFSKIEHIYIPCGLNCSPLKLYRWLYFIKYKVYVQKAHPQSLGGRVQYPCGAGKGAHVFEGAGGDREVADGGKDEDRLLYVS